MAEDESIISRQVNQLATQLGNTMGRSVGAVGEGNGASSDHAQSVALLQGDSAALDRFEQNLSLQFEKIADQAADYWAQHADRKIRSTLKEALGLAGGLAGEAIEGTLDFDTILSNRQFSGALGNLAVGAATQLLTVTRTTSRESDRSVQAVQQFKASRGQTQAALSRQLARGQRYL